MKYMFLFLFIFSNLLSAYTIDELLNLYKKDNDLSKKTKTESLGHLTVYTRDEIERMQAYRLSDLLQSLHLFRYDENMFGMTDVFHEDPAAYLSSMVKIYIDNHEITSAFTGNGLFTYGNIDLGFVDHVEVYEGTASTFVNTDPSLVTIKLYSKDPAREDGTHIQAYIGSRGYNHQNISYSSCDEDLKYYIYASRTDANRKKYSHQNHDISRNFEDLHGLFTLEYKNISVNAEVLKHTKDAFLSYSMFATPQDSQMEYLMSRISTKISFLDDNSLTLSLSALRFDENIDLNMDGTRWTSDIKDFSLIDDNISGTSLDDTYDAKLEKTFFTDNNHLIIGSQFRFKNLHDVKTYNRGIKDEDPEFLDSKILSLYIQNDYSINEQNILSLSGKINNYNNNSNRYSHETFNTYQARAGYIYSSDTDSFKTFISFMQIPTEQSTLALSRNYNTTDILNMQNYSTEYIKNISSHQIGIEGIYIVLDKLDVSTGDPTEDSISYGGSIKYNYTFDEFNKFKSMLYINEFPSLITDKTKEITGGFVQLFNTYKKFNIFNEAVYYEQVNTPMHGVTYNAAIEYFASRDLTLSLKGANIFNSAAKSEYKYFNNSKIFPVAHSLYYAPIDQLITVGLEYSF